MGNSTADALRAELRDRLRAEYGDLYVAATETRIPYKTLYRAFTEKGKDRTASVSLDLIMEVVDSLQRRNPRHTLDAIYLAARQREQ